MRNLSDGTVETVLAGPEHAVEAAVSACWRGPAQAWVSAVTRYDAAVPEAAAFVRLPNALA
ncbi:acylphosphatase [Novosphingobium sp.]|uniref:acylphosphatase n=1 Tax=Novosphingobium sp. TaxID=1874826 RepID=UPI003B529720